MEKWVGLCSPTTCVYRVLGTAPANEHLRSQEQAEVQPSRETACTDYLCKSTFLKASFLSVVFSSCSSDAGLEVWKVSRLGPWPRLFSNTSSDVLLLLQEEAGLLERRPSAPVKFSSMHCPPDAPNQTISSPL